MELVQPVKDADHVHADVHELDRSGHGGDLQGRARPVRRPDCDGDIQRPSLREFTAIAIPPTIS